MSIFLTLFDQGATDQNILDAADAISAAAGQVVQAWGDSALIAFGDPDAARGQPGVAAVVDGPLGALNLLNLDLDTVDIALAWNIGQSPAWQAELATAGASGLTGETVMSPLGCSPGIDIDAVNLPTLAVPGRLGFNGDRMAAGILQHPERRALVGTIGIAIVQIDGPDGTEAAFTGDDWFTALAGVSRGLSMLQDAAPSAAHLLFTLSFSHVKLTVPPGSVPRPADRKKPTSQEYNDAEAAFLFPALAKLGVAADRTGFRQLVANSRFLFSVDWGFVLVVTKYRSAFYAYAPDFRDVVLSYTMVREISSPAILPTAFAHEIGHTVGAKDEYADSNCSLLDPCGFSHTPNANCALNNPFSQPCIMRCDFLPTTVAVVCPATRLHFGWGDQNGDGVLDPFDPTFIMV